MFRLLGVLVICYVAYSLAAGEVYARYGMWGRTARRDEEPFKYWSGVISYSVLALLLFFLF